MMLPSVAPALLLYVAAAVIETGLQHRRHAYEPAPIPVDSAF
jgi:hypothetical protein